MKKKVKNLEILIKYDPHLQVVCNQQFVNLRGFHVMTRFLLKVYRRLSIYKNYVKNFDVSQMAKLVLQLIDSPIQRNQIADFLHRKVEQEHVIDKMAQQVWEVINKVASDPP